MLEPYDGKLSRTVLRGAWGRKTLGPTRLMSTSKRIFCIILTGLACWVVMGMWPFARIGILRFNNPTLRCSTSLKSIGTAISLYQSDNHGMIPSHPKLLSPYLDQVQPIDPYKESFLQEDSIDSHYIYSPSLSNDPCRPICWDKYPHQFKRILRPTVGTRNVLYSDSSVCRLQASDFLHEMRSLGVDDPNQHDVTNIPINSIEKSLTSESNGTSLSVGP